MEKIASKLINKIMSSKGLDVSDLNAMIRLHRSICTKKYECKINNSTLIEDYNKRIGTFRLISDDLEKNSSEELRMFDSQIKRLEMVLKDKLKQINIYLSEDYLNNLVNILFYRDGDANIKDLRLINKHEIAIIRENAIELGDLFYDADKLSPGMGLHEEAYLRECDKNDGEAECYDPEKTFSHFFEKMNSKINNLKETLNIVDRNANLYFDRDLDSFYFDNLKSFTAILTKLPNTIEIYKVDITKDKWMPKKINGESVVDFMDRIDFTLLEEDILTSDLKQRYNGIPAFRKINDFDIEMILEKFKTAPFSLEALVETYSGLFEKNNCMYEEKENAIERLKYITAEKLVQNGFDYEKAIKYAETIFDTIKEYKKQIMGAINGDDVFPNDSLIGVVKKLNYPKK